MTTSNKSNIDEKFYDVGERVGGEGEECLGGGLVKVFNSFRCRAQMHLASGFHFGCGFGLKRFDLWRSDIKIGNMLQQLVPEQSRAAPSRVQVGPDIKTFG